MCSRAFESTLRPSARRSRAPWSIISSGNRILAHSSLFGAWHSSLTQVAVVVLLVLDKCAAIAVKTRYFYLATSYFTRQIRPKLEKK